MRRKEIGKKVLAVIMSAILFGATANAQSIGLAKGVEAAEETTVTEETTIAAQEGTVVLSVEKFTIGQGFVVEPVEVNFSGSTTVEDIFTQVMNDKKIEFVNSSATGGFYVSSIKNADNGTIDIPQVISDMEPYNQYWISEDAYVYAPTNDANDGNDDFPNLGEFAYNNMSGWMYTINGALSYDSTYTVSDGDIIRFQFSVYGYGADIGVGYGKPANLVIPEKEELIGAIAKINQEKYLANEKIKALYDKAIVAAASYDSTERDILKAATALQVAADLIKTEEATQPNTTELETTKEQETKAQETKAQETKAQATVNTTTVEDTTAVKVKKPVIQKLTNIKGKKAKVTLKNISGVTGYQIKYSVYKNFKKSTTKTTKKLTYTMKKLVKNKKYYVKARAYQTVDKKRYYSKWSKVKKITIKK